MEHMRIEVTEHSLTLQSNDPANDEIFLGLNFILSYLTFFPLYFQATAKETKDYTVLHILRISRVYTPIKWLISIVVEFH